MPHIHNPFILSIIVEWHVGLKRLLPMKAGGKVTDICVAQQTETLKIGISASIRTCCRMAYCKVLLQQPPRHFMVVSGGCQDLAVEEGMLG